MELKIGNISKTYRSKKGTVRALEDIQLEVKEGEILCLIGPSGCGKTTLLNIIAGLDEADPGGVISVDGVSIKGPGPDRVVIFQQDALFPWWSVIKNVEFGLRMKGFPREKIRPLAEEFLRMVRLSKFKDFYVHELSGGMRQRVAWARALVVNPKMLLMDEPFGALDAQSRESLQISLQIIWAIIRKTIVFVTHNIREAVCLGDRVLVLTACPGKIKKIFEVNLPRPRKPNDVRLVEMSNLIRQELKAEIAKVAEEECGE